MRVSYPVDNFERCTVASYTEQTQRVTEFPNMASVYGLKSSSRLNEMQFFMSSRDSHRMLLMTGDFSIELLKHESHSEKNVL